MIDLRKIADELDDLYTVTGVDWVLNISHILTEPTCPTAIITPEGWHIARYRVDCDSIEESLQKTVALIKAEVIERKVLGSYAPYSNADDDVFAKWLHARAAGSNDKLPDVPGRDLPAHFGWIVDGWIREHKVILIKLMTVGEPSQRDPTRRNVWSISSMAGYVSARVQRLAEIERLDHDAACDLIEPKLKALLPGGTIGGE